MSFYSNNISQHPIPKSPAKNVFLENALFNLQLLKKDAQQFVERINLMENLLLTSAQYNQANISMPNHLSTNPNHSKLSLSSASMFTPKMTLNQQKPLLQVPANVPQKIQFDEHLIADACQLGYSQESVLAALNALFQMNEPCNDLDILHKFLIEMTSTNNNNNMGNINIPGQATNDIPNNEASNNIVSSLPSFASGSSQTAIPVGTNMTPPTALTNNINFSSFSPFNSNNSSSTLPNNSFILSDNMNE